MNNIVDFNLFTNNPNFKIKIKVITIINNNIINDKNLS